MLAQLRALGELNLDRYAVDGSHLRALKGGTTSARLRSTAAGCQEVVAAYQAAHDGAR